jgi:hypothetical protein
LFIDSIKGINAFKISLNNNMQMKECDFCEQKVKHAIFGHLMDLDIMIMYVK